MSVSNLMGPTVVLGLAMLGVGVGLWTRNIPPEPCVSAATLKSAAQEADSREASTPAAAAGLAINALAAAHAEPWNARFVSTEDDAESQFLGILPAVARPLHYAELTPTADGPLDALFVREGQFVEDGGLLAVIDNRIALASVAAAEAATNRSAMLAAARAKVELARQYLLRIEQAAEKNAASGLEIDEARGRLTEATARVAEGEELLQEAVAKLQLEKARLAMHEIRAPFSGTIVRVRKHEGESLTRGESLFAIADLSRLRSELNLPVSIASQLQVGDVLTVVAELADRPTRPASVSFIAPMIDAATDTVRVQLEIDNTREPLPAGFSVRIEQAAIRAVQRHDKQIAIHPHPTVRH